jgi:hypothetical protein
MKCGGVLKREIINTLKMGGEEELRRKSDRGWSEVINDTGTSMRNINTMPAKYKSRT